MTEALETEAIAWLDKTQMYGSSRDYLLEKLEDGYTLEEMKENYYNATEPDR